MPSHVQTERPLAQKDFAGAGPAHHRTETAARHALASDTPDAALNQSLRSQSLLQTRQALEDSPGVRSQLALQRELNRRPPRQADATQDSRKISAPVQRKPNATGLPDRLKAGVEQLSGLAMDDVRVHYNSSKPATVQAHAYAQGTDIHVGPGQEQHLPHEAWHVVQQKQGRVKPTLQMKGVAINDDDGLEREADAMGWRALRADTSFDFAPRRQSAAISAGAVQAFMNLSEVKADQTTWDYINREFKKVETEYLEAVVKKHNLNWEQNPNHLGIEARRPIVDRIVKDKIADVGDCKESDLKEIVRLMNVMEADTQAQKMGGRKAGDPEGEASDIKIGTEFTFYDPKGAFDGMKVGQSSAADTFMAAWTALVLQQHPKPAMADAKKSKYPKFAKTFTYDLGDGAQWSWTLDVDEGCLETQTTPSTLQQFGEKRIQKIIETDIFGAAKKVNLLPGKGGGHISLDAETTFGGSAEHLLVLLKDLQNEFQTWAKDFYKDTKETIFEESEKLNAAWIGEMTPIHKYVEQVDGLLVQARSGRLDIFGVVDELKAINTKLKNPVAEKYLEKGTHKGKKVSKESAELAEIAKKVRVEHHHYQAVNIEHLGRDEDAKSAHAGSEDKKSDTKDKKSDTAAAGAPKSTRLELRRIPAQNDIGNLVKQVELIFEHVNKARTTVLENLKNRAAGASAGAGKDKTAAAGATKKTAAGGAAGTTAVADKDTKKVDTKKTKEQQELDAAVVEQNKQQQEIAKRAEEHQKAKAAAKAKAAEEKAATAPKAGKGKPPGKPKTAAAPQGKPGLGGKKNQ